MKHNVKNALYTVNAVLKILTVSVLGKISIIIYEFPGQTSCYLSILGMPNYSKYEMIREY